WRVGHDIEKKSPAHGTAIGLSLKIQPEGVQHLIDRVNPPAKAHALGRGFDDTKVRDPIRGPRRFPNICLEQSMADEQVQRVNRCSLKREQAAEINFHAHPCSRLRIARSTLGWKLIDSPTETPTSPLAYGHTLFAPIPYANSSSTGA